MKTKAAYRVLKMKIPYIMFKNYFILLIGKDSVGSSSTKSSNSTIIYNLHNIGKFITKLSFKVNKIEVKHVVFCIKCILFFMFQSNYVYFS